MLFEIKKQKGIMLEDDIIKGLIDGNISLAEIPFEKQTQRIVDCMLTLEEGTWHNIKFTNPKFHTFENMLQFLNTYEFGGFRTMAEHLQTKELVVAVLKLDNTSHEYGSIPGIFKRDPDIIKHCASYDEFQIPEGIITPDEGFEIVKHNIGMYDNLPGDCYTEELNWYVMRDKMEYEAISSCPNPTYDQIVFCYRMVSDTIQDEIKERMQLGDFDYLTDDQKEYIYLL